MHDRERERKSKKFDLARAILSHAKNDELQVDVALGFLCKCVSLFTHRRNPSLRADNLSMVQRN